VYTISTEKLLPGIIKFDKCERSRCFTSLVEHLNSYLRFKSDVEHLNSYLRFKSTAIILETSGSCILTTGVSSINSNREGNQLTKSILLSICKTAKQICLKVRFVRKTIQTTYCTTTDW
ncbi:hypothetical protein WUBG_13842, partial [Wuchereria bancrofti]